MMVVLFFQIKVIDSIFVSSDYNLIRSETWLVQRAEVIGNFLITEKLHFSNKETEVKYVIKFVTFICFFIYFYQLLI